MASRQACASRSFFAEPLPPFACSRSSAAPLLHRGALGVAEPLVGPAFVSHQLSLLDWTRSVGAASSTGAHAGASGTLPRRVLRRPEGAQEVEAGGVLAARHGGVRDDPQVGAGGGEDVAVERDVPDDRVHERLRLRAVLHDRRVGPQPRNVSLTPRSCSTSAGTAGSWG